MEIIKVFGRHIWFSFQMRNMSHFCIKTATSIIKKLFIFLNTLQGKKACHDFYSFHDIRFKVCQWKQDLY